MTAIVVKAFNGIKPISDPRLLGSNEAQTANNVRLISGALSPLRATTTLKALNLSGPDTIFRYGYSAVETNYWLEFAQDTDIMRSPIAQDQWDRLYWTDGGNIPRYAPSNLILSGANYPGASYQLGIPKPSTPPAITAFSPVVNYVTVTRDYLMTYYNPTSNKESMPSPIFSVQGVDGQKVSMTKVPTNNLGDAGITKKNLYRKVNGTWRRLVQLDLATTIYDDTATDASLVNAATLSAAAAEAPRAATRAPSVSANAAATTPTAVSRNYVYTVRSINVAVGGDQMFYAESAPSDVRTVSADTTQTVTIGGFNNSLGGTHYRIYRQDPGATQYRFVAEIPVSQTSYNDVIATTVLGGPLEYDAPSTSKPTGTPTGTVNGSTATAAVPRIYMVTYVDASGNESAKSPASAIVDVIDGTTRVTVTHSEALQPGVTKMRVYRQTITYGGGLLLLNDANWKFVTEVTASTTSITDTSPDSNLPNGLPVALQNLPPAPTGTAVLNATIPPKQVPESRTYVFTYVSAYGEEGPPTDASTVVDLDPNLSVTVSLPGGAPTGNFNITLKRVYRSSTVGTRARFQFVAEMPVATTTYTDNVKQGDLGEVLPSTDWVGPPAGLKGLRLMANGAAVGFVGKTLYFSEPNLPHAWPHQYPIDEEIVGIGVFGQSVAVLTKAYPYLFQGVDPAAMASSKLQLPQACASKRSIVETGDGVIYASPDGLVSIGATVGVVTQPMMSRDQWQQYNPSSMQAYLHNGRVVIFNTDLSGNRGELIFDLSGQGAILTTSDVSYTANLDVSAGYHDATTDTLYLAQGSNIVRWDNGSNRTAIWRSKLFRLFSQENFAVAQVRAAAYPVTFKLYADGALQHTQTVSSGEAFRLPGGYRALDYEFQIETTQTVTEVLVATSAVELKAA